MKIENQVCTKLQGEKLEDLGIDCKPVFCYCLVNGSSDNSYSVLLPTNYDLADIPDLATTWQAPAFTVAELGVMIDWNFVAPYMPDNKDSNFYCHTNDDDFKNTNEAQCRADVLIYLLENNLITTKEVNDRLNS